MKFLPAQTTALKLQSEANRLHWALSQYQAGLLPSAGVAGNVPNGVPATAASVGFNPAIAIRYAKPAVVLPCDFAESLTGYEYMLQILINGAAYARGLALPKALQESSLYVPSAYSGIVPIDLPAAAETSTATTLEQYILEQHLAHSAIRATLTTSFALMAQNLEVIDGVTDNGQYYLAVSIEGAIKKTTATTGAMQYRRSPYDVEGFAAIGGGYN